MHSDVKRITHLSQHGSSIFNWETITNGIGVLLSGKMHYATSIQRTEISTHKFHNSQVIIQMCSLLIINSCRLIITGTFENLRMTTIA